MKVTAIFDIGKTNKKFFLFDQNHREVFREYARFEEIKDEDGFPCDDLGAIEQWVRTTFHKALKNRAYQIQSLNFSTYGASWVHIDQQGKAVTPLYNYLKPIPEEVMNAFHTTYGEELTLARETASPPLRMLNSGLQLYWLKHRRPEVFRNIRWSLHLPQYLSYLFTGIPLTEFTSIGCHTALWDYEKQAYHDWVYAEKLEEILPPLVATSTSINQPFDGQTIKVGVGIHDSSAALLPYIRSAKKPFALVSTGTWSIALNPFGKEPLSAEDLQHDCLKFLRPDGKPVKAARLFLGNEYQIQVEKLCAHFGKEPGADQEVKFKAKTMRRLRKHFQPSFAFESLPAEEGQAETNQWERFPNFETAYHQLMLELVARQILSIERAIGETKAQKIFIDGGFADNQIYIELLRRHFHNHKLRTTQSPLGSALGAALVISDQEVSENFLKKNYRMKKHKQPKLR